LNFDYILSHTKLAGKKIIISTLAPESFCYWQMGVSYIFEDLRETCYRDNYFDWVVSLSTIEHIGMDNTKLYTSDSSKKENALNDYVMVIKEFRRILKPGGTLYLSFPFGRYKNHGWYQVFDSSMVDRVIQAFSPKKLIEAHFRYEPDGWHRSSREESKDATSFDIHAQKSYDPDYAAADRAVVCLEMVK